MPTVTIYGRTPGNLPTLDPTVVPIKINNDARLEVVPWGWDPSISVYRQLIVDATGRLEVVTAGGFGTPENIDDIIFAPDIYGPLTAGLNTIYPYTVGGGYYFQLTHLSLQYCIFYTGVYVAASIQRSGDDIQLFKVAMTDSDKHMFNPDIWMKAGDQVKIDVYNAHANDTINVYVWGKQVRFA